MVDKSDIADNNLNKGPDQDDDQKQNIEAKETKTDSKYEQLASALEKGDTSGLNDRGREIYDKMIQSPLVGDVAVGTIAEWLREEPTNPVMRVLKSVIIKSFLQDPQSVESDDITKTAEDIKGLKYETDKIQLKEPQYDKESIIDLKHTSWSQLPKDGYLKNTAYISYLHRLERKHKLPINTLVEVCKKESKGVLKEGDRPLGSSAGAQGLFQFMPDTAKDRYKKVAAPDSESLAKNPVYAAEAAAMYLAEYGYKSGDTFNMQQALIAYNNGPGYAKEPLNTRPQETQDYYATISANVGYA